jgi:asparagine synthase (glutamine-hydrolysing)
MVSFDGKLVITFNGEIYNYRELRASLEARGRTFRSESDTEVLLHLYAEKGAAMVHELRGLAFALWDAGKAGLLLVRDPYGIKPLYYADDGWTLRFASQVKALLSGGSVPEPFTTFQEVRAVPAGSTIWVDRIGPHEAKQYFSLAEAYSRAEAVTAPASDQDMQLRVQEALLDSVRHHLVADVPVGAFLSSGVDSVGELGAI